MESHEFAHRSWYEQATRYQMGLNLNEDLFGCLVIGVAILTRGRRTGVPMSRLVSYEEQYPSTLETLDTCVCVIGVTPILRRR